MFKRILAGVLAFAVAFAMPGVSVAAQDIESVKQVDFKEARDEAAIITSGDYEYVKLDDGTIEIYYYMGTEANLVIPSQIDGYTVTSLDYYFIYDEDAVTSVTVPATVTNIVEGAFASDSVAEIILEPGCNAGKVVGGVLFSTDGTRILQYPPAKAGTTYSVPYGVTRIGSYSFSGVQNLTSVVLPESVTEIGDDAFGYAKSIKDIVIPNSVEYIEAYAFEYCEGLESIVLPNNLSYISYSVFYSCENLKSVTIPASVTSIDSFAFLNCDSLTDVYYGGSEADWANVTIYEYNDSLSTATIHYNWSVDGFVERMYTIALGRSVDETGYNDWTAGLKAGTYDGAKIAYGIFLSPEFIGNNLSNDEFLNRLYRTFFNREADEAGYNNWMNHLNVGYSRAFVLSNFVNSEEFDNLCRSFNVERGAMMEDGSAVNLNMSKYVKRLYNVVLGRRPDWSGYTNWATTLASRAQTPGQMAVSFFNSAEYLNKGTDNETYAADLYGAFFNRAGDPTGYAAWVNALNTGKSRDSVISEFLSSQEFINLLATFGL